MLGFGLCSGIKKMQDNQKVALGRKVLKLKLLT